MLAVVGRNVGAAAAEADAQRRAREDHRHERAAKTQALSSNQRSVCCTASSMVSFGRHPSARRRAQSRWISGLSPTQPRVPPPYGDRRARRPCARRWRDRAVDVGHLVGAEVVDHRSGREVARDEQRDRIEAVADVEVRLPLPAVAQHVQPRRVLAQRAIEVEEVPVGVALAHDRDEAQDDAAEPVALAVRLDAGPRRRAWTRRRARSDAGTGSPRVSGRPRARRRPSPSSEKTIRRTPERRIASSTVNVAIVFCRRSRSGCSRPCRTSAFAARWKTMSQPAIACSSRSASSTSPSTTLPPGASLDASRRSDAARSRSCRRPRPRRRSARRRSARLLPMKPAPPVTSARPTAPSELTARSPDRSQYPADAASRWNISTVSSENSSRSLPSAPSLASRSCVTVMMWQPMSAAWTMFSTSRGLAQISSAGGAARMISSDLAQDRNADRRRCRRCARRTREMLLGAPPATAASVIARPARASSAP